MAVKLNRSSYEHAKRLIRQHRAVLDVRDDLERAPAVGEAGERLSRRARGARVPQVVPRDRRRAPRRHESRYKFPYGYFRDVHRCGVISAESHAGQDKYLDVENAAAHLHGMLDALG